MAFPILEEVDKDTGFDMMTAVAQAEKWELERRGTGNERDVSERLC